MRNDLTEIGLIVDKSGSMHHLIDDTVGGINSFVEAQRAEPGDAHVTLVLFDHDYEVPFRAVPLATFPTLTREMYKPDGNTALLDAIGRTVGDIGSRLAATHEDERPGKVIVVIVTDGEENSSHLFARGEIAAMVKLQEEVYGWTFLFLGANIDAPASASRMGMQPQNAMNYVADRDGTQVAYAAASSNVSSLRNSPSNSEEPEDE